MKDEWPEKDYFGDNVLLLDRIEMLPEYRGKGYYESITNAILDHFSGAFGLAVMKGFPLQLELFDNDKDEWRMRMGYAGMEKDPDKATTQLQAFYEKIGFTRYDDTDLFYMMPYGRL